jgi:hypothetical protein
MKNFFETSGAKPPLKGLCLELITKDVGLTRAGGTGSNLLFGEVFVAASLCHIYKLSLVFSDGKW